MLSYPYRPLQYNDSIRILILHPSTKFSDPITGTLQHTRLSDQTLDYVALSYTWGDTTQKEGVILQNGRRELLVGSKCYNALQHLRQEQNDRMLWIDAICINQEDLPERARQVRIMDAVYRRASNVVVYLGEHVAESRALFRELEATDELLRLQSRCRRPRPSDIICQQLDTLFERPWFERVWVLQEVCGKFTVIFMCGFTSVSSEAFFALCFGHSLAGQATKKVLPIALQWIAKPPRLFSTPQFNLWYCLYHSRRCLATDPKDKIFALKSLIGHEQSEMDYLINYAQSTEVCFTQISIFLLHTLGLRMLTAVRHPHKRDMPSWIPDWSQNLPLDDVFFKYEPLGERRTRSVLCPSPPDEQEHTTHSFSYSGSKTHPELFVRGCQYAQINESSQVFHFANMEDAGRQLEYFNFRRFYRRRWADDYATAEYLGQRIYDGEYIRGIRYI
jgi:hypothetical protein